MTNSYYYGWPTSAHLTEGQMTPPCSPMSAPQNGSKLLLSRLLRRSKTFQSSANELLHDRFRTRPSVTNMRAPFPLLLPESTSECEFSTAASRSELRRMSASYNDLRCLAQQQARSNPNSPLLPSSVIKEFLRDNNETYFRFHNPRQQPPASHSEDESLDTLSILSYYCDEDAESAWPPDKASLTSRQSEQDTLADDNLSTASESMPVTPLEQDFRPSFCTDESDWLANTTSYDERLRRFKSRYYQVVQQSSSKFQTEHGEGKVMIATVLVGPGKPKLVQIQRPPSSEARSETPSEDAPTPETPKRAAVEVSAFSPYDTPCEEPLRLDAVPLNVTTDSLLAGDTCPPPDVPKRSRPGRTHSIFSKWQQLGSSADSFIVAADSERTATCPSPTIPRRSRTSRSDSVFSKWQQYRSLTDPPDTSPRRTRSGRSQHSVQKRWAIRGTSEIDMRSLQFTSPTTRSVTWSLCGRIYRTMTAIAEAIDDFPANMLQLNTPVVVDLRSPQVSQQMYMDALQRMFPSAPPILISALAAWILVDLYFSGVEDQSAPMDRYLAQTPSYENLHAVPNKAKEMLGIGVPDLAVPQVNDYTFRKRVVAIRASISVIGQRLVEALRGSGDDDIWRSLKVLVEVIASSPPPWP